MLTIIMGGGKGTRIQSISSNIPKPLISIGGMPVLEKEIRLLASQGFKDFIITVSFLSDKIIEYFGDGSNLGVQIRYFMEEIPLGNAGALYKLRDLLTEPFLLLNADVVFNVDFNRMVEFHNSHEGLVTLFTHPNNHPYDSGLIVASENKCVDMWINKEDMRPEYYKNRVNAGLHVMDPRALDMIKMDIDKIGTVDAVTGQPIKVDLDRQVLKPLAGTGKMYCYDSPEYVMDMGTPERLERVRLDYKTGIVAGRNLSCKQKAIFLDRDGTINRYVGFLNNINDFELLPGVAEAIKIINKSGYLVIVVTNQPVIARGEMTVSELTRIHNKMETLLGLEGGYIDGIYYCPHHPDKGFTGEVIEMKVDCECRKPKPGMLLSASRDYNINLKESYMIGDSESDIRAGKLAGCKTVLICSDEKASFGQDITVHSLLDFVKNNLNNIVEGEK